MGRELTKKFEEIKTLNVIDMLEYYKTHILKGEFICMLHKSENADNDFTSEIKKLKKQGFKDKEIAVILSQLFDVNKNDIYKKCVKTLEIK